MNFRTFTVLSLSLISTILFAQEINFTITPKTQIVQPVIISVVNDQLVSAEIQASSKDLILIRSKIGTTSFDIKNGTEVTALSIDDESVYAYSDKDKLISVYSISTGQLVTKIGNTAPDKMKKISGIASLSNSVVVLESQKNKFYFFDKKGIFLQAVPAVGLVSPIKMIVHDKNIFVLDDKISALVKYTLEGKPEGTSRLYVDAAIVDDKKGKIENFTVDPLGKIWLWNKTKNQLNVYQWNDKPYLLFSAGDKEGLQLAKAESFSINHSNYELYVHTKVGSRAFQINLPVSTPANLFGFDIDGEKLLVAFKKDASIAASHYGLMMSNKNGDDSLAYISTGKPFVITRESIDDDRSIRYKLVAINPSKISQATFGFDNFYGLGHHFRKNNKPSEAFGAYQNALRYMGRPQKMVQFASIAMVDIGKNLLAQNIELIKGLNVLKTAYNLNPREPVVQRGLAQGFNSLFWRLAAQENYQAIIEESNKVISQTFLKPGIIQSVDSIAFTLEKLNAASSLTNARLLRTSMVDWAPEQASVWKAVYNLDLILHAYKQKSGSPDYELKALSSEAERHMLRAVELLQKSNRPFITEYLQYLHSQLLGQKYSELEKNTKFAFETYASKMDAPQTLTLKEYQAQAWAGLKKNEEALEAYNFLLSQHPNENRWKESLADLHYALKNPGEAIVLYKQLLLGQKENPTIISKLGLAELAIGNPSEASIQLEKALKLDPTNIGLAGALGEAYEAINSVQRAIDHYKLAITYYNNAKSSSSAIIKGNQEALKNYQFKLGKLYQNNSQYDQAADLFRSLTKSSAGNARYWYGLGQSDLSRGLIYEAVKSFQQAASLESTNVEYSSALQSALELRAQVSKNIEPLAIVEAKIVDIYPSLYLNYGETSLLPIGHISLTNNTSLPIRYENIKVEIPQLMNEPTVLSGGVVTGYSNSTIYVSSILSQAILNFSQGQKLQAKLSIAYTYDQKPMNTLTTVPVTVQNRNAINWADKRRIASFIAVGPGPMTDYALQANKFFADLPEIEVSEQLSKAIQLYTLLKQEKLNYIPDPNLNYSSVSSNTNLIDFIQYPGETLKKKGGDCDDLVALYASLLENSGIATALIDVPGHIFMAMDLGISSTQIESMGFNNSDVLVSGGKVWLPIETTLIGNASFIDAWLEAAKRYHLEVNKGNTPDVIPLSDARKVYRPSMYHPTDFASTNHIKSALIKDYQEQLNKVFSKLNEGSLAALKNQYLYEPYNVFIKNKYAVILAQSGRISEAKNILNEALRISPGNASVLNNLGNVSLLDGDLQKSIEYFEKSHSFDATDYQTAINLVRAYLRLQDKSNSRKWLDIANQIDSKHSEYFNKLINQIK